MSAVLIGFRLVNIGRGADTERVMYDDNGFFCVIRGLTIRLDCGMSGAYVAAPEGRRNADAILKEWAEEDAIFGDQSCSFT